MPFTMASYSSSQPTSASDATSTVDFDAEMMVISSSPPAPPSQASSAQSISSAQPPKTPSQPPTSELDYSVWTAERYTRFPGLVAAPDSSRERAWWWQYGYKMKNERSTKGARIKWVCVRCFERKRGATQAYTFVASTGLAVVRHLKRDHSIQVSYTLPLTH